jgi:hypothetical protein
VKNSVHPVEHCKYNCIIDCCATGIMTENKENKDQVGEATGQSTENRPTDRQKASILANALEGLDFPADKAKILSFVNQNSPNGQMKNSEITQKLQDNLTDNKQYANVFEIEKQVGLVTKEKQ